MTFEFLSMTMPGECVNFLCTNFDTFWSDLLATVIGGVVLAFLFFLIKEWLMPPPKIVGRWYLEQCTTKTSYASYKDMKLRYVLMLYKDGLKIEGTAEKIYESSVNGDRPFVGEHRTRAVVTGTIEKNYLSKDRVYLHIDEDGHGRSFTTFYEFVSQKTSGCPFVEASK